MKHLPDNIILLFVACLIFYSKSDCTAQSNRFLLPLNGVQGKDYWISYYVDHNPRLKIKDGMCGTKTYDGHRGTDFLIRDFRAMDSGVSVFSIADGVVYETRDGLYDRNKRWENGGLGNYIAIIHKGKYLTYYGHLRKNSIQLKQGDSVTAGQVIGMVGSSGYSSGPHLHLEVKKDGHIIDPFLGECNNSKDSFWTDEPLYDTLTYAIDMGFVPYIPNADTLKERFRVTDTFSMNTDKVICFWVLMHGLHSGDKTRIEWLKPDGTLWFKFKYTWKDEWWFDYNWFYIDMPDIIGVWTTKYYINDKMIVAKNFCVTR